MEENYMKLNENNIKNIIEEVVRKLNDIKTKN